jgi:hypothetical protein
MSKFFIKIEGQVIDMPADQSVTLEKYNPIFDFDEIRGAKVMDFTVPFSPIADRLFNWYGLHQTSYENKRLYCEKYAEGLLIEKGFVELLDVVEEGYVLFFSQNLGEFWGDLQSIPMNLIDFGSVPAAPQAAYNYTTHAVAWPKVKNTGFYGNVSAEVATSLGAFDGWVNDLANADSPKVPMPGLRYVFDKIAELTKVTFTGDFFESEYFKLGLIENLFAIDDLTTIEVRNHLWATTIPGFLIYLAKYLNYAIYIDASRRVVRIQSRDLRMRDAAKIDLTSCVVPSRSRKPEKAKRLELDWQLDSNDARVKVRPSGWELYQTPGGENDSTQFFPIKSEISTRDVEAGTAIIEQLGISSKIKEGNNVPTPKLLLWAGGQKASNKVGVTSLLIQDIVTARYSYYQSWRARTASRTVFAKLDAAKLAELDFHTTGGENSVVYIHGRDYLIESIRVNLPNEGLATLELWEK